MSDSDQKPDYFRHGRTVPDPAVFKQTPSELDPNQLVYTLWYAVSTLVSERIKGHFDHEERFVADPNGSTLGIGMRTYINVATVSLDRLPVTPDQWEQASMDIAENLSMSLERDPLFPAGSEVHGATAMLLNEDFDITRREGAKPMILSIPGQPREHKTVQ